MIDLGALRALIAVRDHGSVVAAADVLGFTPSAVSQQIKRLEQQQHTSLLERVGRGVVLTDVGRQLAERGGDVLGDLEALAHLGRGSATPVGPLHLATFATAARGLVAPMLPRLAREAPQVRATVQTFGEPREVLRHVERGRADVGLVHDWESVRLDLPPGVEEALLLVDRADVVVHRDHPLAGRGRTTPRELVHEPWVSTPVGTICHDWLVRMFAEHALRPDLRFVDPEYASHVALAAQGAAVALVPRMGRGPLPDAVVAVPVEDPVPHRRVRLVWRRATTDSPARKLVHRLLEEVAAGSATAG